MTKIVATLLMATGALWGQALSIGVKGAVPFTNPTGWNDESRPYIVGPSVELRLPAGFAIEADALYRRIGYSTLFYTLLRPDGPETSFSNRVRGNSWEFPLLGKYYFRRRSSAWQPFVATGWSLRTTGFHTDTTQITKGPNGAVQSNFFKSDYRSDLGVGAAFAAGVRLRYGRIAFTPEMRYTRWGGRDVPARKNEAAVMLGVSF